MAEESKEYLDYDGLTRYDSKIKEELDKKVNIEPGKGLSERDFTEQYENKLNNLTQYTLPPTDKETLGGVKIEKKTDNVDVGDGKRALKVTDDGTAFVDWSEAPKASDTVYGLMKVGKGLSSSEDGTISVDDESLNAGSVDWDNIQNKPNDLVTQESLKGLLTNVYTYKGSVNTYEDLKEKEADSEPGDVYNVKDTGMNYAYLGDNTDIADSKWDSLGGTFKIETITSEQIDALFAED